MSESVGGIRPQKMSAKDRANVLSQISTAMKSISLEGAKVKEVTRGNSSSYNITLSVKGAELKLFINNNGKCNLLVMTMLRPNGNKESYWINPNATETSIQLDGGDPSYSNFLMLKSAPVAKDIQEFTNRATYLAKALMK